MCYEKLTLVESHKSLKFSLHFYTGEQKHKSERERGKREREERKFDRERYKRIKCG